MGSTRNSTNHHFSFTIFTEIRQRDAFDFRSLLHKLLRYRTGTLIQRNTCISNFEDLGLVWPEIAYFCGLQLLYFWEKLVTITSPSQALYLAQPAYPFLHFFFSMIFYYLAASFTAVFCIPSHTKNWVVVVECRSQYVVSREDRLSEVERQTDTLDTLGPCEEEYVVYSGGERSRKMGNEMASSVSSKSCCDFCADFSWCSCLRLQVIVDCWKGLQL